MSEGWERLKLYAWQPKGHGETSFFVMAENEEQALEYVEAKIAKGWYEHPEDAIGKNTRYSYEAGSWGTDYYELTVADVGQVITNDND